MLKRISYTVGLLGVSLSAFAGAPGNNMVAPTPSGVVLNAPDSDIGWSVGIEGLYAQPTGNNFQYSQVNDNSVPANTQHDQSVNNSYQWGGEADATYRFDGNSRDVTLGYSHLDSDDSDTTHLEGGETFNPILSFGATPISSAADTAKGEVDDDYNAVDLTFGQQFLIGERVVLHPFGGLRYASIDQDDKVAYTNSADATDNGSGKIDSDFQGAGPRAGIDARILTSTGFSIIGAIAGSLLVGDTDSHASVSPSSVIGLPTTEWDNDDTTHLVPELDARVALDYTPHKLFPEASMSFQVGYEVVHYFDVAELDGVDSSFTNSVNNTSSYGYQGPYLRLQLNVA